MKCRRDDAIICKRINKNVSSETRLSVLSRQFYFYRKRPNSPESAPNEFKTTIHHQCDELRGQRMAVVVGGRGDASASPQSPHSCLGNPRSSKESMSSEKRTLPPYQRDRIRFDASRSLHDSDALVSDPKWKTIEEGSSSTELVSKWWKERPVASPVTQLSYSPFYYCSDTIMDYLFLLSGMYLPQLPFFRRGGGIVGTWKLILKGHIGIVPLGHERIRGTRSPRIPMYT
jgi:hypothetical protein